MTYARILHKKRDGFTEELIVEEVAGYEKRLKVFMLFLPQVCCPNVMQSLSIETWDSQFLSSLREGGQLWQYLYSWKFFFL